MNSDTYKQAFSALHASDEIKLENDMEERKTNRKFHARPALAVCLCVAAALGCFSTAFALDAGGIKTAIEDGVKTIQLKAGEKYVGKTPNGSEYEFQVADDCEFDVSAVVSDDSSEVVSVEIRDKNSKAQSDKKDSKDTGDKKDQNAKKAKNANDSKSASSNSESNDKSSDDAKSSK